MKKLNLVNKEASDIEYVISKYPDGQQNIEIQGELKTVFLNGLLVKETSLSEIRKKLKTN